MQQCSEVYTALFTLAKKFFHYFLQGHINPMKIPAYKEVAVFYI